MSDQKTEVLIAGGGLGGVAAALALARSGHRVRIVEETDWLGGQLTSQAVPPDEHPWVEQFGVTATYADLRRRIRDYYRRNYPLRPGAIHSPDLNPGAGTVSKLCAEPRAGLAAIDEMLAPHVSAGRIAVDLRSRVTALDVGGDTVHSASVRDLATGAEKSIAAQFFLDATETGELLPLSGTEYVTGAEGHDEHGEPHAPAVAEPQNMQGFTICFAISHHQGQDHTIDRPQQYEFWRGYHPDFWPSPLLSLNAPLPQTLEPHRRTFVPDSGGDPLAPEPEQSTAPGDENLWVFRRILARRLFADGAFDSDIVLANWPMNDYWLGSVIDVPEGEAARHLHEARQLSLSVLYWLQTEAPRPDGGTGWPGLLPRGDVTGTVDGLAKSPYIRESRRIRALRTVTEHDVSLDLVGPTGGTRYDDSVGIGSYRIDLHPSTGGDNYIDIASVPFEIPLGALVPQRIRNLLPAGKNIGTTHISNGCYRLHPVEWNIGEASGALAAMCITHAVPPQGVHEDASLRSTYLRELDRLGIERHWPEIRGY